MTSVPLLQAMYLIEQYILICMRECSDVIHILDKYNDLLILLGENIDLDTHDYTQDIEKLRIRYEFIKDMLILSINE